MLYKQTQYLSVPGEIKAKMPKEVFSQLFGNGGLLGNSAILQYFGDLDLSRTHWSLESVPTANLTEDVFFTPYKDYIEELSHDMDGRGTSDLKSDIGSFSGIEEHDIHWLHKGTWMVPPIFVRGSLLSNPQHELNLLEGNSRVGYLRALHNCSQSTLSLHHKIYIGKSD